MKQMQSIFQYETNIQNLYETLLHSAQKFPEKIALIDDKEEVTYCEFLRRVDVLADYMQYVFNIKPGDKVAIMQLNSINFCTCFYATLKLGAIAVMISTKLQAPEISFMLKTTSATVLILNSKWWGKVIDILKDTQINNLVFDNIPDSISTPLHKTALYDVYNAGNFEDKITKCYIDSECTAVIMFTSGTTGKPKGAMISHKNLVQSLLSYKDLLNMNENEVFILPIPIVHITGLCCVLNLCMYIGGTVILMPYFNATEVLQNIEKYKVTHFHAVPTVFIELTKALENFAGDVSSLRTALCGGGFITHEAICDLKSKLPSLDFRPVYGLTESAGAGVGFPCDYLAINKPTSAGKVVSIAEILILSPEGEVLPTGGVGEICFRGPSIIKQYYGMNEFNDELLHTGDLGKFDEDGFLYVMDRIKDVINRGGEKIFSLEVENVIMKMDGIHQVAVFGVPHKSYGEIPVAAIIPKNNSQVSAEQIQEFLKPRIAKYKIPQNIYFVDSLPCNGNNKVLKATLRKLYVNTAKQL